MLVGFVWSDDRQDWAVRVLRMTRRCLEAVVFGQDDVGHMNHGVLQIKRLGGGR